MTPPPISLERGVEMFRAKYNKMPGSRAERCKALGTTTGTISNLLAGRCPLPKPVAEKLGLERVIVKNRHAYGASPKVIGYRPAPGGQHE